MKIATTGSEGNIGRRLVALGCESLSCDVTNPKEVESELHRVKPDVILHLAAMTSVDWCEKNFEKAVSVNVFGTNVVCEMAEHVLGAGKVAVISSDMVFDGKKGNYSEYDEVNPINNYGLTKVSAEGVAHLYHRNKIVRLSRCFDSKSKDISEYVESLKKGEEIYVPEHIRRSYCHLDLITLSILHYAQNFYKMPEVLNIAGTYHTSFWELMRMVAVQIWANPVLVKNRGELPGFSPRPHKTGLDVSLAKKVGVPIYPVEDSVKRLALELR